MMDHVCFRVVFSSNEAASRLLANSILLCDIKDYHSMGAEKKPQWDSLGGGASRKWQTISGNLYLMSKRAELGGERPRPHRHGCVHESPPQSGWSGDGGLAGMQWERCNTVLSRSNLSLVTGGAASHGWCESEPLCPLQHGIQIIRENPKPCCASEESFTNGNRLSNQWGENATKP